VDSLPWTAMPTILADTHQSSAKRAIGVLAMEVVKIKNQPMQKFIAQKLLQCSQCPAYIEAGEWFYTDREEALCLECKEGKEDN